jgi:hypothetical protein
MCFDLGYKILPTIIIIAIHCHKLPLKKGNATEKEYGGCG